MMLSELYISEYYNNNKSGKMSTEKYISKNFSNDYDIIIEYCHNELENLPFKEKVYHTINNLKDIHICNNPGCNNRVKFKNSTIGYLKYCCNKCVGTDPYIKKKKEDINVIKFGTKYASLNEDVKKKVKKIYENRTDDEKSKILNKRINTVRNKYGVDNVNQLSDVVEKRVITFKRNIETWKNNYKKTSMERYGVTHPWMNKDIHEKGEKLTKKLKELNLYKSINRRLGSYENLTLIDINYNTRNILINCDICNNDFQIHREYLQIRHRDENVICTHCNPTKKHISGQEKKLHSYIQSIYNGEIILSDRKILEGKELDIYLPELNLAFEFNGLYWHSELHKNKKYHSDKSSMCESKEIHLIHIYEDDWLLKRDIIKSIISNKIGSNNNRIFGRKCEIREVHIKDSKPFLDNNHIQGNCKSSIKIGLYFNDELVSLMVFGKPRKPSKNSIILDGEYELMRYCNKIYHNVIGGSSKLFKYFINKYSPSKIISYSDISIFDGKLYKKLGFINTKKSDVNYTWVIGKKREHKGKFRKSSLIKMGYNKNKSEKEIMYEDMGSFRIWDCGLLKWEYINYG